MPAVDAVTGEVLSTWSPVDDGHHLASCDTYIAGRVLRVFDHQAPRAILTVSVVLQRESDQARSRTMHNHDRSYVRQRLDVTPKTTEQNRIILTSKSEVEVTNNFKKNCARGIVLLTQRSSLLTDTKHARPLCDSRATCYLKPEYLTRKDLNATTESAVPISI